MSDIHFEEISGKCGHIGLITLTRPQALNALNHAMFLALNKRLAIWENAAHIKAVVIQAEGRAFCAGGDIRQIYERRNNDPITLFHDEYQMNQRIYHFPKPYIALLNGITMGGGVGISWHGSHRVATEKLIFSMPETAIGFYPDVGTTYHLSRIPFHIGIYLGLTGTRLNADDSVEIGFAQHKISSDDIQNLMKALIESELLDKAIITRIINQFSLPIHVSEIFSHKNEIDDCFSADTVDDIFRKLENHSTEWCSKTVALLKEKSPTSLKVTLLALQKAKKMSFDECMKMEYRLTHQFIHESDFFEGIRAVVIDKDKRPQWKPATLLEVHPSMVQKYFSPIEYDHLSHSIDI